MDMQATMWSTNGNALLAALGPECLSFLVERMLTKPIMSGEILCEPDAPLMSLIFPHDGLISFQATLQDGRTVEKMSVGRDGFVGLEYLFGETRFPSHAVTVIPGRASWLSVHDLAIALEKFPEIRRILSAYALRTYQRLMQTIVCASLHSASERIATWLLHAEDCVHRSSFDLTQRTLANIFGLRLATVSDACARLQAAGAIDHSRGSIRIANRAILEAQACECYEAVRLPAL